MTLAPSSTVGRALAALWLALCVCVLVFGFVQQDIHDMPVAFMWFMIFLTCPLGFLGIAFDYFVVQPITNAAGSVYHPFISLLPSWFAMTVLGYLQWFKLAPAICALSFRLVSKLFARHNSTAQQQ